MQDKSRLYFLVILLIIAGTGLILYKHLVLGFPLLPDDKKLTWIIEAKIDFIAQDKPVIVSFALPSRKTPDSIFLAEDFASPDYGYSELNTETGRRAQWSKRKANGPQTVYYRLSVTKDNRIATTTIPSTEVPPEPDKPEFDEVLQTAAIALLKQARNRSANIETFTRELIKSLNAESPTQNQSLLINDQNNVDDKANLLIDLLALENISAKIVRGLYLEGDRRRQSLNNFIEVYDGTEWLLFNQDTGELGLPENFLIWQRGGQSLLDVVGGKNSQVYFSIIENVQSSRDLALGESQGEQ
nr:UUP1 family membrane protein [Nitrosomonas sp.]